MSEAICWKIGPGFRSRSTRATSVLSFCRGNWGKVGVALYRLFAEMFAAAQQEYCKRQRQNSSQSSPKFPVTSAVVTHFDLR